MRFSFHSNWKEHLFCPRMVREWKLVKTTFFEKEKTMIGRLYRQIREIGLRRTIGECIDAFFGYVLTDDEAILLRAEADAPHPLSGKNSEYARNSLLRAGEEFLLCGPIHYRPHRNIRVKERRQKLSLSETEGKYVQNDDTGEVVLVSGPSDFFLGHNQTFWNKDLTSEEREAFGYIKQSVDHDARVLAAQPRRRISDSDAVVIDVEDNECICVYGQEHTRVEFGPQTVFLHPYEHPKVLYLSGGVPIRPNVLRVAKLKLGPDFIRDRIIVRTRDNAELLLDVIYRWRFDAETARSSENPSSLFSVKDFVGFVAQTLASEIREEAAKHDFENFHSGAGLLVKKAIFADANERVFTDNLLIVFGIDVETVRPQDAEITETLAEAIKTNVRIYTERVQEEAKLASEARIIEGKARNEEARAELLKHQLTNDREQVLGKTLIEVEAARARDLAKAESLGILAEAKRRAEEARLQSLSSILETEGGKAYIELQRARILRETDKVVVPTNSHLRLFLNKEE